MSDRSEPSGGGTAGPRGRRRQSGEQEAEPLPTGPTSEVATGAASGSADVRDGRSDASGRATPQSPRRADGSVAPLAAPPDVGPDPARALLARARAGARAAPRPGARRRRRPGDQGTRSGAGPDERDPQPFATALDKLSAEHGWELDLSVHAVLGRWPELVGADLAAHCAPEGFTDGVLAVRAESSAWATQLRLLAPALVSRLNAQVGAGTVTSVVVRGPDGPRWSHGSRTVRGRGPRDTYG